MTITRADATLFRPHTFGHLEQSHFKQEQGHLVQAGAFLAPGSSYQLPAFICAVLGIHCSRGPCDGMPGTCSGCSLCPPEPMPRTESAHERVKEGMSRWANKPASRADVLMGCTNPWDDKGCESLLGWDLLLRPGPGKGLYPREGDTPVVREARQCLGNRSLLWAGSLVPVLGAEAKRKEFVCVYVCACVRVYRNNGHTYTATYLLKTGGHTWLQSRWDTAPSLSPARSLAWASMLAPGRLPKLRCTGAHGAHMHIASYGYKCTTLTKERTKISVNVMQIKALLGAPGSCPPGWPLLHLGDPSGIPSPLVWRPF